MKLHRIMEIAAATFLVAAAVCLLVSCASKPPASTPAAPLEEVRKAMPDVVVKSRRPDGTFDTPSESHFGLPITRKRFQFADSGGNLCVTEWMQVKHPTIQKESKNL